LKEVKLHFKAYKLVSKAVETGINTGWSIANKDTDTLDERAICLAIYTEIMNAMAEVIDFET
jgi:hypothetical protein